MKINKFLLLAVAALFLCLGRGVSFSQEPVVKGGAVPETPQEPETQWVWGEVTNVDLTNKTAILKYLDYETDQEKEISVIADEKTTYENIKSLDELKPLDTVSVDYVLNSEGKNIAKNISIERPQEMQSSQEGGPAPQAENPQVPATDSNQDTMLGN